MKKNRKKAAKEIDNCIQIHKNRLNSYASLLLITYIGKTQLINCNKAVSHDFE